ncbi:MAG TPA: hypothetical protein VF201_04110, partial [Nitrolancea sp.]
HTLVEEAPQILPLAGTPNLVIVGREVTLGNNAADLIALESSGRVVIIEIKLAKNSEARRAVIAQILTYAAYLHGLDSMTLETVILRTHLDKRGYENLVAALESNDQEGSFDHLAFSLGLTESLSNGRFRLVVVLDEVPEELVRLTGYLQQISDKVLIDLIRVSAYDIAGSKVLVPQRVDPESQPRQPVTSPQRPSVSGQEFPGADYFENAIESASQEYRMTLTRLTSWAKSLEANGLVKLSSYQGKDGVVTLLPRLKADKAGLVTVANDGRGCLWMWRSVFERRAPLMLSRIEELVAPVTIKQGSVVRDISDELLEALTSAYREAVNGLSGSLGPAN